jgi:hypothetical protein
MGMVSVAWMLEQGSGVEGKGTAGLWQDERGRIESRCRFAVR